jgi:hypothetical protein
MVSPAELQILHHHPDSSFLSLADVIGPSGRVNILMDIYQFVNLIESFSKIYKLVIKIY